MREGGPESRLPAIYLVISLKQRRVTFMHEARKLSGTQQSMQTELKKLCTYKLLKQKVWAASLPAAVFMCSREVCKMDTKQQFTSTFLLKYICL